MNILMVSPFAISTPHYETELEIIQKHLDRGDNIVLLGCNASMMVCDVNTTHNVPRCIQCMHRRVTGAKLLSSNVSTESMILLGERDKKEIGQFRPDLEDIDNVRELYIDNFDIGNAALSSVISQIRDPAPDLQKYEKLIRRYMISSLAVYRSMSNHLAQRSIDRVYAYNGRYASLRAVLRACQKEKVNIFITERGGTLDHYAVFQNTMPLDVDNRLSLMLEAWDNEKDPRLRDKSGSKFYIDRANNIVPKWIAHTKYQQKNLLPDNWDTSKNNIAIFVTSEDEIAAIGYAWKNPIYRDQMDGIYRIIDSTKGNESIRIYLRIHPNLRGIRTKQTDQLYALSATNLMVIRPESEISSYALIRHSSKVVTFGSTVGIEAVYWGAPSILAGQSLYRKLGGTYQPNTHAELIEMLHTDLTPQEKTPALIYGFFEETYGIRFKYYESHGIFEGTFKGVAIKRSKPLQALQALSLLFFPLDRSFSLLNRWRLQRYFT